MRVQQEIKVCGDCLQAIANGFDPNFCGWDGETAAAVESGLDRLGDHVVAGDGELGFCRSACECCNRPEYGERYEAAILGTETAAQSEEPAALRQPSRLLRL